MRFKVAGTHGGKVGIVRIINGKWKEAWYFADELGLLLQLDAVDRVLGA